MVGGSVGVILIFAAVLLILDRAIGFSGWGLEEAERTFARLVAQRRRERVKRRLRRRPRSSEQLGYLPEDSGPAATAQRRRRWGPWTSTPT